MSKPLLPSLFSPLVSHANGTAAVLEGPRFYSQIQTPHTNIFALWVEGEVGKFDSDYFDCQSFQSEKQIPGVINVDMTLQANT